MPEGERLMTSRSDGGSEGVKHVRPTAVDLFSGAGGMGLGFEQAGCDIVAAFDYDPVHVATHSFNFPRCETVCADLSTIDADVTRRYVEKGMKRFGHDGHSPDLVIGGPPCQGFSLIGKREADDERNDLVHEFLRLVEVLEPRFFVMENVPGIAKGEYLSAFRELIEDFEEAGYDMVSPPRVLNAAEFGVPQDRKRLFLIGSKEGQTLPEYPAPTTSPVPKRGRGEETFAERNDEGGELPTGPSVSDAIGDLPALGDFDELCDSDSIRLSERRVREMEDEASKYVRRLRDLDRDSDDYSYPRRWEREVLTCSLRTMHKERSVQRFEDTDPGETESVSRFYRLAPDGLCNTLRAGTGSERGAFTSARPIHPSKPRVLSVREAARLHSYPDWFRFHATNWHGFRQVGNSVPPLLARAVAGEVVHAMRREPQQPEDVVEIGDERVLSFSKSEALEFFEANENEEAHPAQRAAAG